jgi:hypothetical protein
MDYGNKQHSHRVPVPINGCFLWFSPSYKAPARFYLISTVFSLAMADVSDTKINEGAFVNSS